MQLGYARQQSKQEVLTANQPRVVTAPYGISATEDITFSELDSSAPSLVAKTKLIQFTSPVEAQQTFLPWVRRCFHVTCCPTKITDQVAHPSQQ